MSEEDYAQIKKKFSVEREEAVEKERKKYEGDLKFELGELKQQVRVSSIAYSVSCRGGVARSLISHLECGQGDRHLARRRH